MIRSRAGARVARLVVSLALLMTLGLIAASSSSAAVAYPGVYVPWPFDRVTYYADPEEAGSHNIAALNRVVSAFNRGNSAAARRLGIENKYELVEAENPRDANITFTFVNDSGRCYGDAYPGWYYEGTFVTIYGGARSCDPYTRTLAIAHEIGHVFLLIDTKDIEDEANKGCSIMNSITRARPARFSRPNLCRRGVEYWRRPFSRDDLDSFLGVRTLRFRLPYEFCEPGTQQSQFVQEEALCKYEYDCRAASLADPTRTAPNDPSVSPRKNADGRYPWLEGCVEQPYRNVATSSDQPTTAKRPKQIPQLRERKR